MKQQDTSYQWLPASCDLSFWRHEVTIAYPRALQEGSPSILGRQCDDPKSIQKVTQHVSWVSFMAYLNISVLGFYGFPTSSSLLLVPFFDVPSFWYSMQQHQELGGWGTHLKHFGQIGPLSEESQ